MELTRRGFLGAAAGAALFGCARRRALTGRIVGQSEARGHRLRSAQSLTPSKTLDTGVAVIGGGIAGLSAAWKLARSGFEDFVVLELEDEVGGTASSGRNAVCAYPWGAHYIPVPTREEKTLDELLLEMGVIRGFDARGRAIAAEEHLCRAPQERLYYRGAWLDGLYLREGASANDLTQLAKFEEEIRRLASGRGRDGKRWFAIPVEASSADPEIRDLDTRSIAQWLDERGFDSPRLRWYVEYACRDDFGCRLTETSAWAALHYFASRWVEGEGAAEFLTWPEGNGFVVDHLRRAVKEKIVSGAVVASVKPDRGTVDAVALLERTGEALRVRARRAVCAVPRYAARRMVPALAAESGAFRYSPWVVANLTLERPPEERGVKGAWDNVLYESDSLGYVVATHQLDRRDPATVWTWYRPFCDLDVQRTRAEILTADWTHWRDAVLTDLRRAHPDLDDCAVNLDVQRWGHAMVRPEPGFLFGAARAAAQRPLDGIHFAGADLGGLPLFEEAQYSGVKAAEAAMAELGHPFTSSL